MQKIIINLSLNMLNKDDPIQPTHHLYFKVNNLLSKIFYKQIQSVHLYIINYNTLKLIIPKIKLSFIMLIKNV
jgi:hypothetical protein